MEKLILQTGGVKSLIGCLHGIAAILKNNKTAGSNIAKPLDAEKGRERLCPIPDGLPKSLHEVEEEERARMPDSPFTRLLRTKGRSPAWYSPAPDHETDWFKQGGCEQVCVQIVSCIITCQSERMWLKIRDFHLGCEALRFGMGFLYNYHKKCLVWFVATANHTTSNLISCNMEFENNRISCNMDFQMRVQ